MSSVDSASSWSASRRRWWPRRKRSWAGIVALGAGLVLLCVWLLARATPGWYSLPDPNANAVLDEADAAQRKLAFDLHNALQRVPLGEQRWTITQDEINALLAVRFAPPLNPDGSRQAPVPASAGGLSFSGPFVDLSPGKITLAVRSPRIPGRDAAGGVGSVTFVVETRTLTDGSPEGVIKIDGAHVGYLPVPKSMVEKRLQAGVPGLAAVAKETITYQIGVKDSAALMPQVEGVIRAIANGEPFPLRFKYDRREVIVKEIRVEEGSLTVVFVPPARPGTAQILGSR